MSDSTGQQIISNPSGHSKFYHYLPWLILFLCVNVIAGSYDFIKKSQQQKKQDYFFQETGKIEKSLTDRFAKYDALLVGSKGLFAASKSVDRAEWRNYVSTVVAANDYPGLAAIGYVVRVPEEGVEAFLADTRADGAPEFQITPSGKSKSYDIVTFAESRGAFTGLIGNNLGADPTLGDVMETSRDSNQTLMSAKKIIRRGMSVFNGVYVFLPVYGNGLETATLENRRQALVGWILGIFDESLLFDDLIAKHAEELDFEIFDSESMTTDTLLYDDDHVLHAIDKDYHPTFSRKTVFSRYGRARTIYFTTRASFDEIVDSSSLYFIIFGGGILSLLIFFLLKTLVSTRAKAMRIAEDMTSELKSTLGLQRAILDGANYSIISTEVNGIIRSFNKAAEHMLGYAAAEVVGKVTPEIIHDAQEVMARADRLSKELGCDVQPGFDAFVAKARLLKIADENEWTYIRKNGTRLPVKLSVTALRDDANQVTAYLGIAYDLTEFKRVERMKNEFISTVSHELRTPLTSIRGSLGLVSGGMAGTIPERAKTLVDIALNNCERLVRLINDILDMEKIDSGKMEFVMAVVSLRPFLENAIKMNDGYGKQYDVRFVLAECPADILLWADADRLMQVVTNLLSNAAKFSQKGGEVIVSAKPNGRFVRISIKDSGRGIPPEFRSKVFEKFAQADGSDSRQKGGTGLGLNIVKSIVAKLGGTIAFDSMMGKGTTFYFDLPAHLGLRSESSDKGKANKAGPLILVCEDDPDVSNLLCLILAQHGFTTERALSAKEARELLKQKKYAGMTLDIGLSDVDGLTLLRSLREDAATRDLPIVVVSAKASAAKKECSGSTVGVIDWIEKPIDEQRLLGALSLAVHQGGTHRGRILHVEDDADTAKIVAEILKGFADVETATTLAKARARLKSGGIDLIILDLQLPDGSGLELLSSSEASEKSIPIVVFSSTETNKDLAEVVSLSLLKSVTTNEQLSESIKSLLQKQGLVGKDTNG